MIQSTERSENARKANRDWPDADREQRDGDKQDGSAGGDSPVPDPAYR